MRPALDTLISTVAARFGPRCSVVESVRRQHGRGEALDAGRPPDVVVWPESTAEIVEIVKLCAEARMPIVPHGAGTSLEGHVSAPHGGVCIDLTRMNRIVAVRPDDADCTVEPGVTREQLNAYLRDTGLFFPVDPGANATLGGMVATRASGTTTLRYGSMWHNVLALQVVLADGRVVRLGTRARKSSAGYDLVRLLIGSEGTLGIVSEITLRLHPQPEQLAAAVCSFARLRGAVGAVQELAMADAGLARMEFLDEVQVRACNRHARLALPEQPTLFLEFHGSAAGVRELAGRAEQVARDHGGQGFAWAERAEDRSRLWHARHTAYFAALALRPGAACIVADVCVPISELADSVAETRAELERERLLAPIVGHVGDGNYHVLFLLDPTDPAERARVDRVYDRMVARAQAVGGTCTGEHGIGIGKRDKLRDEYGDDVVELMRAIKAVWDPHGIMNPGKVLPEARARA